MERDPQELEAIAERLERLKPTASQSELGRIKARALARASTSRPSSTARRPHAARLLHLSARAASLVLIVALFGGGTVVLAGKKDGGGTFSGGSSSGSASNTQYCPPGSQQPGKQQDPRPEICGVALTPGYWKNHQRHAELLLPLNLGSFAVTSFKTATTILNAMNCSSTSSTVTRLAASPATCSRRRSTSRTRPASASSR